MANMDVLESAEAQVAGLWGLANPLSTPNPSSPGASSASKRHKEETPRKFQRVVNGKGGKGKGPDKKRQEPSAEGDPHWEGRHSSSEFQLLKTLVLRHEHSLRQLAVDRGYVLFFSTSDMSTLDSPSWSRTRRRRGSTWTRDTCISIPQDGLTQCGTRTSSSHDQSGDCGGSEDSKGSCANRWSDPQVLAASQAVGQPTIQGSCLSAGSDHKAHGGEGTCRDVEAHQLGSHFSGGLADQTGKIADIATGQAADDKTHRSLRRQHRDQDLTTRSGITDSSHPESRGLRTPHPEAEGSAAAALEQLTGYSDPLPPGSSSKGSASVPEGERTETCTGPTVSSAGKNRLQHIQNDRQCQ